MMAALLCYSKKITVRIHRACNLVVLLLHSRWLHFPLCHSFLIHKGGLHLSTTTTSYPHCAPAAAGKTVSKSTRFFCLVLCIFNLCWFHTYMDISWGLKAATLITTFAHSPLLNAIVQYPVFAIPILINIFYREWKNEACICNI